LEFSFLHQQKSREVPSNQKSLPFGQSKKDSLGSDRLRKAIERNRAKQEKRDRRGTAQVTSHQVAPAANEKQMWSLPQQRPMFAKKKESPLSKIDRKVGNSSRPSAKSPRSGARRKTIGRQDDFEFSTPVRKGARKTPAKVSYLKDRKSKTFKPKSIPGPKLGGRFDFRKGLMTIAWVGVFGLLLRLVFTERGVIDYYSRLGKLEDKNHHSKLVENENRSILKEIELIRNNRSHQRKLVRDHLGFIAEDEYLILFAKEGRQGSI